LIRTRRLLATSLLAMAIPLLAVGCGGDDEGSDEDPQAVLDATFGNDERISSGSLELSISGSAEGDQGGSFEATLSGPFQGDPEDPNALPQLDWDLSASGEGAGQSFDFEAAVIATEDNAFIEYGGETYEVGTDAFAQFKQQAEQAAGEGTDTQASVGDQIRASCEAQLEAAGSTDTSVCEIDFQSWLGEPSNEGTEDIEGTDATHISGDVDLATVVRDLVEIGAAAPGAEAQGLTPEAIESQLGQVEDAVEEASFDIYSGTEDDLLRGLDFNLAIDPSAIPNAEASGIDSIDANFTMRIAGVNEEQTVEAPSGDARPIDELLGQVPGLEGLGGLGALGGGGLEGLEGGGGAGGGDPNAYFECVEQAQTTDEINACASQL
jgi:hypothetical protein